MNELAPLAPVLGGLGSFAFACIMCFVMVQQMRHRDDRANNREDRMMTLVENHLSHNTEAIKDLTVVVGKLDRTIEVTRPR